LCWRRRRRGTGGKTSIDPSSRPSVSNTADAVATKFRIGGWGLWATNKTGIAESRFGGSNVAEFGVRNLAVTRLGRGRRFIFWVWLHRLRKLSWLLGRRRGRRGLIVRTGNIRVWDELSSRPPAHRPGAEFAAPRFLSYTRGAPLDPPY